VNAQIVAKMKDRRFETVLAHAPDNDLSALQVDGAFDIGQLAERSGDPGFVLTTLGLDRDLDQESWMFHLV
jgi:hypothetical protein